MNADELAAIRERDRRDAISRFRPKYEGGFPENPDAYPEWRDRVWFDAEHDRRALLAEVDRLTERLAEYENAINWETNCTNCAHLLDECYRETVRAEKAEAEASRLRLLDALREES